jgi:thymidylate synthase
MSRFTHRNISFATVAGLGDLISNGALVEVRGSRVRELRNYLTVIERPRERCPFMPHRGNDIVASLAETLWVVAGRNDFVWLSAFLPRAARFSDDGTTWRAAYGPRLRNWNGVDQLAEARRLLLEDISTRRAAMSLYDPDRDFVQSKDIPCTNWLHWLARDGNLHLTIGMRSNDVMWGFSGVNSFEWSILQDMMAFWIGAKIGDATYLGTSFHLYAHHDVRARKIVDHFTGVTCYEFGLAAPAFSTPFDQIDQVLATWFALESEVRNNPDREVEGERRLGDQLLSAALELTRLHHGASSGWSEGRIAEGLAQLPSCDLKAAAYEFYGRQYPIVLDAIPDQQIARFIAAYQGAGSASESVGVTSAIVRAIKHLHAQKNSAYGTAWKRRGELTSVLCNIARKVDRLEQHATTRTELVDESVFDTAVDLFVYLLKYRLFLLDRAPVEISAAAFLNRRPPFSEDQAAFDESADGYAARQLPTRRAEGITSEIVTTFERLHRLAEGDASVMERLAAVSEAADLAFELVLALARERPRLVRTLAPSVGEESEFSA